MSEPRHAMIFRCDENHTWLNIVPEAVGNDDRSPLASVTYGPFFSIDDARKYADENFQNTGYVIPVYQTGENIIA